MWWRSRRRGTPRALCAQRARVRSLTARLLSARASRFALPSVPKAASPSSAGRAARRFHLARSSMLSTSSSTKLASSAHIATRLLATSLSSLTTAGRAAKQNARPPWSPVLPLHLWRTSRLRPRARTRILRCSRHLFLLLSVILLPRVPSRRTEDSLLCVPSSLPTLRKRALRRTEPVESTRRTNRTRALLVRSAAVHLQAVS
eukprot:Amastigsp_a841773_159.p2 type:complete len:203 gc:universal Amastigsp_a841773_159:103-711(+)